MEPTVIVMIVVVVLVPMDVCVRPSDSLAIEEQQGVLRGITRGALCP